MFKYSLDYFLDFLFPRENLHQDNIHCYISDSHLSQLKPSYKDIPNKYKAALNNLIIASDYHDPVLKDLISRAKFSGETGICNDLANILETSMKLLSIIEPDIVIPVPADPKRYTSRGYHIPNILATHLAKKLNAQYSELIIKTTHTESQINLTHEQRLSNLNKVFSLNPQQVLKKSSPSNILILDDISTTGTTIGEVSLVIKAAFPSANIFGLACASN